MLDVLLEALLCSLLPLREPLVDPFLAGPVALTRPLAGILGPGTLSLPPAVGLGFDCRDPGLGRVINGADLAAPDGAPVAWRLRMPGFARQQRINGPDLMWKCCAGAAEEGLPVFLYGSTPATLRHLCAYLAREFPRLTIAGCYAPPFRPLTPKEDAQVVRVIEESGARVVFVGLGCPKQEVWMAAHRGRIRAVMIGVGAAFDYHAGVVRRAPRWMRDAGLECLHRLVSEPRRLWRRYFVTNTLFLAYIASEMITGWRHRIGVS